MNLDFDSVKRLNTLFYSGKYNDILTELGLRPLDFKNRTFEKMAELQIGSLVFTGQIEEATQLFASYSRLPSLSNLVQIVLQFYLGIGNSRRSSYKTSILIFSKNFSRLKQLRKGHSSITELRLGKFYVYQGAAFIRFFSGKLRHSEKLAKLAYLAAFETDFKFGQVLSLDLLGHCHCQLGDVGVGLHELERALQLGTEISEGVTDTALKISLIKYRSQFGLNLKKCLAELDRAIRSLRPEDTYSKAELILESARQMLLRGRASDAQKLLDETGDLVHRHSSQRQSAIYNLRYAHLLFLQGQTYASLALIRSVMGNLDPKIDLLIFSQAKGLENKITVQLNLPIHEAHNSQVVSHIDQRITSRRNPQSTLVFKRGEDPLGDLIDRVATEKNRLFDDVKTTGLLGLIPAIFSLPIGKDLICLSPKRGELIICHRGDVFLNQTIASSSMIKLIQLMSGGELKQKKWLIENTWGYTYLPDRHDKLLHATIGKLRSTLRELSSWIEWGGQGYRLLSGIKVLDLRSTSEQTDLTVSEASDPSKNLVAPRLHISEFDLNVRQMRALKLFKSGMILSVSSYAKRFKVTTMTALRDVQLLVKRGDISRYGRARATLYCQKMSHENSDLQ